MTDGVNLNSLTKFNYGNENLRNFDFGDKSGYDINNAESQRAFSSLLDKNGVISLDDGGRLTVVNPQRHSGNVFVRAIKFIFNSEYRAESRALDRLALLKQNASFTRMLVDDVAGLKSDTVLNADKNQKHVFKMQLKNYLENHQLDTFNPTIIKDIKKQSVTFTGAAGSILEESKSLGKPVSFKGQAMSIEDFLNAHHPKDNGFDAKSLLTTLANNVISQLLIADRSQITAFDTKDIAKLSEYLAKPQNTTGNQQKIRDAMAPILNKIFDKVSQDITDKLSQGYTPESIATKIVHGLNTVSGKCSTRDIPNKFNDFLNNAQTFADDDTLVKSEAGNQSIPDKNSPLYNNYQKIKNSGGIYDAQKIAQLLDITKNNDAKVESYIKVMNMEKENPASIVNLFKDIGEACNDKNYGFLSRVLTRLDNTMKSLTENMDKGKFKTSDVTDTMVQFFNFNNIKLPDLNPEALNSTKSELENILKNIQDNAGKGQQTPTETMLATRFENGLAFINSILSSMEPKQNVVNAQQAEPVGYADTKVGYISNSINALLEFRKTDILDTVLEEMKFTPDKRQGSIPRTLIGNYVEEHLLNYGLTNNGNPTTLFELIRDYTKRVDGSWNRSITFKDSYDSKADDITDFLGGNEGIKKEFMSSILNKSFERRQTTDANGNTLTYEIYKYADPGMEDHRFSQFNNVNLSNIKGSDEKTKAFLSELEKNVPQEFRKFTSHFVSKRGILMQLETMTKNGMFFAGMDQSSLLRDQLVPNSVSQSSITVENGIMKITTEATLSVQMTFGQKNTNTELKKVVIESSIDLSKGVDKNYGYPNAISFKTSFKD